MKTLLACAPLLACAALLSTGCETSAPATDAGQNAGQDAGQDAGQYDDATRVDGGRIPTEMTQFGGVIQGDIADALPVEAVLKQPETYHGQMIRVQGTVVEVCQPKGCWVTLGDPNFPERGVLLVKFVCPIEDERLVPIDAPGSSAVVEGKLEQVEISEDFARHLAMDAGKSEEEIEQIVGPQTVIRMSSPAAEIECKPFSAAGGAE